MPVRDHAGAIRYLDYGNVPASRRVREWNTDKLSSRLKSMSHREDYELVISDLMAIGRGELVGTIMEG
jgi:methylaspartate mutase epsilon subunit